MGRRLVDADGHPWRVVRVAPRAVTCATTGYAEAEGCSVCAGAYRVKRR